MNMVQQRLAIASLVKWQPEDSGPDWCFRESPMPDFPRDANSLQMAEVAVGLHDRENHDIRVKWINLLRSIVDRRTPRNKSGSPMTTDVDLMTAYPEERAEALLRLFKLWTPSIKP